MTACAPAAPDEMLCFVVLCECAARMCMVVEVCVGASIMVVIKAVSTGTMQPSRKVRYVPLSGPC